MSETATRISTFCLAVVVVLLERLVDGIPVELVWVVIAACLVGFIWPHFYIRVWNTKWGAAFIVFLILSGGVTTLVMRGVGGGGMPPPVAPIHDSIMAMPPAVVKEDSSKVGGARTYIREESADEVIQVVTDLPPLERDDYYRKAYGGKWVKWSGVVSGIRLHDDFEPKEILVSVLGDPKKIESAFVWLRFPESDKPYLEQLRRGDRITFEGRIEAEDYDWSGVSLEAVRITGITRGQ